MKVNGKKAINQLTPRQLELCKLVCEGLSNVDIGKRMGISRQTAEVHRYNAYRILGVHNTAQLFRTLIDSKLIGFLLGAVLCSSVAFAGEFKQDGGKLVITLDTTGQHHTTGKGTKVLDTIHGTLPDGSRFQARVYVPRVKASKVCGTDSECEGIK